MIGYVDVTDHGRCVHCKGEIERGRADFELNEHWWHVANGRPECPGSPIATPEQP